MRVVPVPDEDLPVTLPDDAEPRGRLTARQPSHLEACPVPELWDAGAARDRHLRHLLAEHLVLPALLQPVEDALDPRRGALDASDHYIGGIEHACMHLLYSLFMKALSDLGYQVPGSRSSGSRRKGW